MWAYEPERHCLIRVGRMDNKSRTPYNADQDTWEPTEHVSCAAQIRAFGQQREQNAIDKRGHSRGIEGFQILDCLGSETIVWYEMVW